MFFPCFTVFMTCYINSFTMLMKCTITKMIVLFESRICLTHKLYKCLQNTQLNFKTFAADQSITCTYKVYAPNRFCFQIKPSFW
jgi:hypothetical protein